VFANLFKKNAKPMNLSAEENLDHIEELTDNEAMAVVGGSLFNGGVAISFDDRGSLFNGGVAISFDDRGNGTDQDFQDFTLSVR
jgi:hypothetical protein